MSRAEALALLSRRKIVLTTLLLIVASTTLLLAPMPFQLLFVGMLIGFVFIHFGFGFAGNWQLFFETKQSSGIRGHLWLLAIGTLIFFPALTLLPEFGFFAQGAIRPLGFNVLIGAFIFGIGMGLLGNCSSGTIRLLAEFRIRYYWVLICMVVGGTFAAAQFEVWQEFEQWGIFSFATDFNWFIGLMIHIAVIALLYQLFIRIEQKHHGEVKPLFGKQYDHHTLGAAPVIWAAFILVFLNLALLVISGFPWGVSWIFPKMGILAMDFLSLEIDWEFWEYTAMNEERLFSPFTDDTIMLTSVGFFSGIALYHFLSHLINKGENSKRVQLSPFGVKKFMTATFAGLIMGYGAVTAFGCNIGGFFSAIISGSLHGWLWFVSAFTAMGLTIALTRSRSCS